MPPHRNPTTGPAKGRRERGKMPAIWATGDIAEIIGNIRSLSHRCENLKSKTLMLVNVSISGAGGPARISTRYACKSSPGLCWNMKKPYICARMERVENGGAAFCNTIRAGVVPTWDNWMLRFVKVLTRAVQLSTWWTTQSSSTVVQNLDTGQLIGKQCFLGQVLRKRRLLGISQTLRSSHRDGCAFAVADSGQTKKEKPPAAAGGGNKK